jgi:hypothetical protein
MEKINGLTDDELIEAVNTWTGYGSNFMPSLNGIAEMNKKYGAHKAAEIIPYIIFLEKIFYQSNAKYDANSPSELIKLSIKDFVDKMPEIPIKVAEAFAWCYSFDNK